MFALFDPYRGTVLPTHIEPLTTDGQKAPTTRSQSTRRYLGGSHTLTLAPGPTQYPRGVAAIPLQSRERVRIEVKPPMRTRSVRGQGTSETGSEAVMDPDRFRFWGTGAEVVWCRVVWCC
ncbi:hypothetical protein JTE90_029690 [Oedothorax gibbosus]|uniref:Uncharacterized protein n=1 Tax=Oedothorax gibbosus TaxID=931172 RepID=A0AAV6TNX5_9ARAC|nr:hypothetical protein JTE90_029690 [Oedothorax gibbosus]